MAFGVALMVANTAVLVLWNRYWRGLFFLPPALILSGLLLVLLPERLTRFKVQSKLAGTLLLVSVVGGLAIGVILAYDPVAVIEWVGLAR